jgi:HNH endonuclease
METKTCSKCKMVKSVSEFAKSKSRKDGRRCYCRACVAADHLARKAKDPEKMRDARHAQYMSKQAEYVARAASRRAEKGDDIRAKAMETYYADHEGNKARRRAEYAANPEPVKASSARAREKHPGRSAAYAAQWRANDPEKARESNRRSRAKHPETRAQWYKDNPGYHRRWRQSNRTRVTEASHRRRSRAANVVSDLSAEQIAEIHVAFDHRCAYCGKKAKVLTLDHITPLIDGGPFTLHNIVPACKTCNSKKARGPVLCPVQPLLLTVSEPKKPKNS